MQTKVCLFPPPILYARIPGLLARACRDSNAFAAALAADVPLAVADGKAIRDACPHAARRGVHVGDMVSRARRICPALLVVPLEDVDHRAFTPLTHRFLDILANHTPAVEPDEPDAAYADFSGGQVPHKETLMRAWNDLATGFPTLLGFGSSKNAARACAECALPPDQLSEADARWLWPEDPGIASRLFRLGLSTFGQVETVGEDALVYQFGKMGRLLYLRSVGRDFAPVRALYPPPQADLIRDFALEPIDRELFLAQTLGEMAGEVAQQLWQHGRHARRLRLCVRAEDGCSYEAETVAAFPLQRERDIASALERLRQHITLSAPVMGLFVSALDLDLPPGASGSLFDSRAAERALALAATKQRLHAKFGVRALRLLGDLPLPQREMRRALRREKQRP